MDGARGRLAPPPTTGARATAPASAPASASAEAKVLLRRIAVVAIVDALLLVALVAASLGDRESAVNVLGPLHGAGFLLEVYLAVRGAGERLWGWWFPAAIAVTAGPLGALAGHRILTRRPPAAPGPA